MNEHEAADLDSERRQFARALATRNRRYDEMKARPTDLGADAWTNAVMARQHARDLAQFGDPKASVAFGRIDMAEPGVDYFYIGNKHIDCSDFQVLNWRAPAAKPFYAARASDTHSITRRRKYDVVQNHIRSFDDEVFADIARRVAEVAKPTTAEVADDALLGSLGAARDSHMKEIAQTIQAAQYDVMTEAIDRHLVVQGGAGTGKTAIALHRVSWMLYSACGDLQPHDVLVIGPSQRFNDFIRQVLPSLGDSGVHHANLYDLGPASSDHVPDEPAVAALKSDARMAQVLDRALYDRVSIARPSVVLGSGSTTTVFLREEIEAQIANCRRGQSYNKGRAQLLQWLSREMSVRTSGRESAADSAAAAVQSIWPATTPMRCLAELFASEALLGRATDGILTSAEQEILLTHALRPNRSQSWSDADVALLDELAFLMEGRRPSFRHVVVDEAQDLTPMQVRSVLRRAERGRCTLVGDIAQSTGVLPRSDWSDVIEALGGDTQVTLRTLELGYRVPGQVFDVALRVLTIAAPGVTPPRAIRLVANRPVAAAVPRTALSSRVVRAAKNYAGAGLSTAVICPVSMVEEVKAAVARGTQAASHRCAIEVLAPLDSKGLEFDAVVLVEPGAMSPKGLLGARALYIALTRTTNRLSVVHSLGCELLGLAALGLDALDEDDGRRDHDEDKSLPDDQPSPARTPTATPAIHRAGQSQDGPARASSLPPPRRMSDADLQALLELVAAELRTAPDGQRRRFLGALSLVLGVGAPPPKKSNTQTQPRKRSGPRTHQTQVPDRVFVQRGGKAFHASVDCPEIRTAVTAGAVGWCSAEDAHRSRLLPCKRCAKRLGQRLLRQYGLKGGRAAPPLHALRPRKNGERRSLDSDQSTLAPSPYGQPTEVDDVRFSNRSTVGWGTASYGQHPEEHLGSPTDDDNDWRGSSSFS